MLLEIESTRNCVSNGWAEVIHRSERGASEIEELLEREINGTYRS